jgi:hypothetical protein
MKTTYTSPYPTIKDLIAGKSYDNVSYRILLTKETADKIGISEDERLDGEFMGVFAVDNGMIKTLDGDYYNENESVYSSEEYDYEDNVTIDGKTQKVQRKGLEIVVDTTSPTLVAIASKA